MKDKLKNLEVLAREYYAKSNRRERLLILAAGVSIFLLVAYQSAEYVFDLMSTQSESLAQLEATVTKVPSALERYAKLKARKDGIEKLYREVEIAEGAGVYIENIIKSKAQIELGAKIDQKNAKDLGGNYEQVPFQVEFTTSNLEGLGNFLREIVAGPKPLILSKLILTKIGFNLQVKADIITIRQRKEQNEETS